MGQKVNPIGLRTGIIRNWDSRWYADKKEVAQLVKEDYLIRRHLRKVYKKASLSHAEIERIKGGKNKDRVKIRLYTGRPGVVIGHNSEIKNKVVKDLEKLTKKEVYINVVEVKRPEKNAQIVADSIAMQLENRASFRRVQKLAIQRAMRAGAEGCKTLVSGRLGGAEIARSEGYAEGRVPLHTLRADVDYAVSEAKTTYGILGVKVWIYNGEILPGETREEKMKKEDEKYANQRRQRAGERPFRRKPQPNTTDKKETSSNKGGK